MFLILSGITEIRNNCRDFPGIMGFGAVEEKGKFDQIYHLAAWTQAGDFCLYHAGEQWIINQQINTNVLWFWREHQPQAVLIAMGTGIAWIYSTIALLFPQIFPSSEFTDVYYDVTVVVTALVVLGLAMELKAKGRTSEAIKKLIGLRARTARVVREGREQDVPIEQVSVGDMILVRPGEKIPVDGAVTDGISSTHHGKEVGFCCEKCKAKFDADPAKFEKKIK